eukprot:2438428-Alexandrium_andersonii.AAC.1
MRHLGMAEPLVPRLEQQWSSQVRWASLGGAVHPEPLHACRSLPQGDPWGPLASAWAPRPPRCARGLGLGAARAAGAPGGLLG